MRARRSWVTSFTAILAMAVLMIMVFSGCSGVQIKEPDPEVTGVVLHEAGYTLAVIALKDQPERRIDRAKFTVEAAIALLEEEKDIGKVIGGISDFVETYEIGDDQVNKWRPLAVSTVNILQGFIELDLDIPEKYNIAFMYTKSFLEGALAGIESLI